MDKMGYEKGLIRYTTENLMAGKGLHLIRPRIVLYGLLLLALAGGLVWSVANRVPVELDIMRDRNALYRETEMGLVENIYTLKIINMDERPHSYRLVIDGLPGAELDLGREALRVPAGEVLGLPVRVRIDPVELKRPSSEIRFILEAVDDPDIRTTQTGRFLGPVGG